MTTIEIMARISHLDVYGFGKDREKFVAVIERFAALVRADEREAAYKRRGVLMFNPYSGTPRHPSDIQSDPHAILLLDPEQPIRARGETK